MPIFAEKRKAREIGLFLEKWKKRNVAKKHHVAFMKHKMSLKCNMMRKVLILVKGITMDVAIGADLLMGDSYAAYGIGRCGEFQDAGRFLRCSRCTLSGFA